jgi:hypothetical protein
MCLTLGLGGGAGWILSDGTAQVPADKKPADPAARGDRADAGGDDLARLRREYRDTLKEYLRLQRERIQVGQASIADSDYISASKRLAEAEQSIDPSQAVAAWQTHVDLMKQVEQMTQGRVNTGRDPPTVLAAAKAARLEAEITLAELKARPRGFAR